MKKQAMRRATISILDHLKQHKLLSFKKVNTPFNKDILKITRECLSPTQAKISMWTAHYKTLKAKNANLSHSIKKKAKAN